MTNNLQLNAVQSTFSYRPIDQPEVQHAVHELHGVRVILKVNITADPENADGGLETHAYYNLDMCNQVIETRRLLRRVYSSAPWSDVEAVVDDVQSTE